MIKILIIEDESEKKRLLIETLLSVEGITYDNIEHVSDVRAAKKAIRETRFELVILDINVPPNPELKAEVGAGLAVISFIKNNLSAKPPAFIVGMTAYDDGLAAAEEEFSSPLWKLVRFSYTELAWQQPLKGAVKFLIEKNKPPYITDGQTYHTDLAIFVALENEELQSIRQLNADWVERKIPNDHSRYFEGRFSNQHGELSVVVVAAPKMGLPTAAAITSKLIHTYRPRYLCITGICAGVRDKVKIGDILVADPCFDWGSGKWARNESGEVRFRPAPYPWRLEDELRSAIKTLSESAGLLSGIHEQFAGNKPAEPPEVIVEAMASGGSVLQVAALMDDVRDQHKNLVGVEMESYAVFTAAEYATEPRPKCFSIKAVCDFGDEDKGDTAHAYAAYVSAQFLYHFALEKLINQEN